ncbi:hypothetical protein C8N24_6404 [Solirubrobacter pauli]|uniref:Uncharacterized protein n=1 Tax=Solirubrobacter pauli TaxID=166793 RepID=A0A660L6B3_9ACTN|nr:hypothetical protein [Solirubrobacter pauli]RKQ88362.1 hypothetical protein C8N24_6404 [Solirubrobacter pauli]
MPSTKRELMSHRIKVPGIALTVALLAPWFEATSDGDDSWVAGWDTDPWFTIPMFFAGMAVVFGGIALNRLLVVLGAIAGVGLTVWMLPRGEEFSGYALGPGGFIAVAAGVAAIGSALWRRPTDAPAQDRHSSPRRLDRPGATEDARN